MQCSSCFPPAADAARCWRASRWSRPGEPGTSSSGSRVRRRNSTTIASSALVRVLLRGWRGPIGASAVLIWPRHLATVLGFSPYRAAGHGAGRPFRRLELGSN
jgi:hypothetical protein